MDLRHWQKVLKEAERELEGATTRTTLDTAAKKLMRAKRRAEASKAEVSA